GQRAQVRALRAYFYMRLCDMFGRVKIITEPGKDSPQATRLAVYNFVESELLAALGVSEISANMDLSGSLLAEAPNQYRINRWAALGILAKLYLNAEVYSGTAQWNKAAIAASYIIDKSPYRLCGSACKVTNLGKRPGVASDPAELTGYAAVFAP
ncbi:MAG TPA: RagB/SusD family nutrient uptake outer membrane protein, partial [Saprospiraceae bacterium]|nr:RagB/SusD family nutrient uptake outer membrane protein [Saprospiraceae bacterium]